MIPLFDSPLDLDRLLKLRLVVARHGEMDGARWWNTQGMLGPLGATVLSRSFPRTHWFAQARVVFAVASSRCHELFDPPGCMTLWHLPDEIEDSFSAQWQRWMDEMQTWVPFFEHIAATPTGSLVDVMKSVGLLAPRDQTSLQGLHRSAEGRAIMLPGLHRPSNASLTLLAAGFSLGELGSPATPYARIEG